MKVVFILTHIPNPRMYKRIGMISDYATVSIVCARRKSQDLYTIKNEVAPHYIFDIDLPKAQQVMRRLALSIHFQRLTMKRLRKIQPDIIYAEGFDTLMIACRYQKVFPQTKVVYEVADLREVFLEKPNFGIKLLYGRFLKKLESHYIKAVSILVVTSMAFYDVHYWELINRERVVYQPNIPDRSAFSTYHKKKNGPFTVGFIGGIRYLEQMKMLVDAAQNVGCRVLFAGAGGTNVEYATIVAYCQDKPFVTFTGKYNYDRDIAHLYGMVDCVYAVYNADNPNVRIALPNKLYESIYCQLPVIVAKNTYLEKIVNELGAGVAVGHKDRKELEDVLRHFTEDKEYCGSFALNRIRQENNLNIDRYNKLLKEKILALKTHTD